VTLTILLWIFATNFMDRQIVAILVEPIKHELMLSGSEMALLYGFAFAVLYVSAGIPIARLADRRNRARIVIRSLMLFSVVTVACGLATSYGNCWSEQPHYRNSWKPGDENPEKLATPGRRR
jgi:MFS family permease